ncbi:hypothetical protein [Bradyrhizobium sp. SYSU BS000235]|uniref:hypothetical protein n=1 Tax=Bradyrhizobium sp. SYSU BS000235 TaxID=3411332 RepID=UPI003C75B385
MALFYWLIVFPWILLLSVLLPTHKLRIVGMPWLCVVQCFLPSQSPQPLGNMTSWNALWLGLWLVTCVAVTLLVPQLTTVVAFIIFAVKDMRKRWMRRRMGRAN